jgi:hypothetical protein
MMTKREAKEICLEVWGYLAEHPEIVMKNWLPSELYEKIEYLDSRCPLCEVNSVDCSGCPLSLGDERCFGRESVYSRWARSKADDYETRREAALRIVEIVEAWEPEEEDYDRG